MAGSCRIFSKIKQDHGKIFQDSWQDHVRFLIRSCRIMAGSCRIFSKIKQDHDKILQDLAKTLQDS